MEKSALNVVINGIYLDMMRRIVQIGRHLANPDIKNGQILVSVNIVPLFREEMVKGREVERELREDGFIG